MLLRSSRAASFLTKKAQGYGVGAKGLSLLGRGIAGTSGMIGKGIVGTAGMIGRGIVAHPRLSLAGTAATAGALPTVAYGIQQSEASMSPQGLAYRRATGYRAPTAKAPAPMGSLEVLRRINRSLT